MKKIKNYTLFILCIFFLASVISKYEASKNDTEEIIYKGGDLTEIIVRE